MTLNRRNFLKAAVVGSVACGASVPEAQAREPLTMPTDALGLLYDSTLCIGCKACMSACKTVNNLPFDFNELKNRVEFENGKPKLKLMKSAILLYCVDDSTRYPGVMMNGASNGLT